MHSFLLQYHICTYIHLESRVNSRRGATVQKMSAFALFLLDYFKPIVHYCPCKGGQPVIGAELDLPHGWCPWGAQISGSISFSWVYSGPLVKMMTLVHTLMDLQFGTFRSFSE